MKRNNQKYLESIVVSLFGLLAICNTANAGYWLVMGSYRQAPGSRPEVIGITSPSLYAIPMESLELCKQAGNKITDDIFKPVWQFDNRWTCIFTGKL